MKVYNLHLHPYCVDLQYHISGMSKRMFDWLRERELVKDIKTNSISTTIFFKSQEELVEFLLNFGEPDLFSL